MKRQPDYAGKFDRSARRLFLGETWLLAGGYLLFTLILFGWAHNWFAGVAVDSFGCIGVAVALLVTAYLAGFGVCCDRFFRKEYIDWRRFLAVILWAVFLLAYVLAILLTPASGLEPICGKLIILGLVLIFLIQPLAMSCSRSRREKWLAFGSGTCTLIGIAGLLLPLFMISETLNNGILTCLAGTNPGPEVEFRRQLAAYFEFSGLQWNLIYVAAIILLLAGYWMRGKLLSRLSGLACRIFWSKTIITLWVVAFGAWLAMLGLMLYSGVQIKQSFDRAATFWGRPVTPEALNELYLAGQTPDPAFWARFQELEQSATQKFTDAGFDTSRAMNYQLQPDHWRQIRAAETAAADKLKGMDQLLAQPLPKYPLVFEEHQAAAVLLPYFSWLRSAARLQLWRIRLALESGDQAAALTAWKRMAALDDFLRGDVTLISQLVRLAISSIRLDGLALLLESDLLNEAELRQCRGDLDAMMRDSEALWQRCLYGEAVFGTDVVDMIAEVGSDSELDSEAQFHGLNLRSMRWVLPQFEYWIRCNLRTLNDWYVHAAKGETDTPAPGFIGAMLTPALTAAHNRFTRLDAQARAMQALIDVELYYRRHGQYPAALPETAPSDPFGDTPLLYAVGDVEIEFARPAPAGDSDSPPTVYLNQTGPAVKIWSVGPDLCDNDGKGHQDKHDDITVLKRLKSVPDKH